MQDLKEKNGSSITKDGLQVIITPFMKQPITGYHKDEKDDWVAELKCGHNQHVRHDPPWQLRPWVTTEEGRKSRLGHELDCKKCDRGEPKDNG